MGRWQCLPLSVVQLKGKHCHWQNKNAVILEEISVYFLEPLQFHLMQPWKCQIQYWIQSIWNFNATKCLNPFNLLLGFHCNSLGTDTFQKQKKTLLFGGCGRIFASTKMHFWFAKAQLLQSYTYQVL